MSVSSHPPILCPQLCHCHVMSAHCVLSILCPGDISHIAFKAKELECYLFCNLTDRKKTKQKIYSFLPNYLPYFENITETSLHGWTAFYQLTPSFDINIIVVQMSQLASEAVEKASLLVTWAECKCKESWWWLRGLFNREMILCRGFPWSLLLMGGICWRQERTRYLNQSLSPALLEPEPFQNGKLDCLKLWLILSQHCTALKTVREYQHLENKG